MNLEILKQIRELLRQAGKIANDYGYESYEQLTHGQRSDLQRAVSFIAGSIDTIDGLYSGTSNTGCAVVVSDEGIVPVSGTPEAQHAVD